MLCRGVHATGLAKAEDHVVESTSFAAFHLGKRG